MIGRIQGTLVEIDQTMVLVDVAGVGYEIECPVSTLCELPAIGQDVRLWTHFVVREDAQLLYGFLKAQDRACFRILIKISGVGPKLAVAILSGLSADELAGAVERDDVNTLTRLPGIGRKTAERLVVELRGRLGSGGGTQVHGHSSPSEDAISGLITLGYKEADARKVLASLPVKTDATPENLIRAALKTMLKTS